MPVIEIWNESLKVGINTVGSELMYINGARGTEFLWNGNKDVWSYRSPVLFPICGGLKDDKYTYQNNEYVLGKHGFARKMEFEGKKISDTCARFLLKSNVNTLQCYPFDFELQIEFQLEGNKLIVTNSVKNTGVNNMYFSVGAHEGYACPKGIEDYYIEFDEPQTLDSFILNGNLLEDNSERIIENSTVLDLKYDYFSVDALVFKNIKFHKASLVHKSSNKKVSVEFDKSNYFLLWTKPGAEYICLEPWDGVQDIVGSDYDIAEKEGIIKLLPQEIYDTTHTMECFE